MKFNEVLLDEEDPDYIENLYGSSIPWEDRCDGDYFYVICSIQRYDNDYTKYFCVRKALINDSWNTVDIFRIYIDKPEYVDSHAMLSKKEVDIMIKMLTSPAEGDDTYGKHRYYDTLWERYITYSREYLDLDTSAPMPQIPDYTKLPTID